MTIKDRIRFYWLKYQLRNGNTKVYQSKLKRLIKSIGNNQNHRIKIASNPTRFACKVKKNCF